MVCTLEPALALQRSLASLNGSPADAKFLRCAFIRPEVEVVAVASSRHGVLVQEPLSPAHCVRLPAAF